jgi:hypothetical protein
MRYSFCAWQPKYGEVSDGGLSIHEKKSTRSLMMCFLALECGYWHVSQSLNGVSSKYMIASYRWVYARFYLGVVLSKDNLFFPIRKTNKLLEPVCKIRKEEKRGDCYHGREIGSPFLITSGDASELLKTIDKAFDNIAFAIK